ncbi:Bax inhibitor 1 [Aphelenchoides bicaudatus]|nr:Bax inhibitor 1 [Aphelenchoides bicaudatus]
MTSYYRQAPPEQRHDDIFANIQRAFSGLNNKLEKDVRQHLKNVYSTLTLAIVTAMVGVVANHLFSLHNFHLLFTIGIFGLVFALHSTPPVRETEKKRLTYLFALSFLIGVTTGPLVSYVAISDPSVVFNAYMITLAVFGCFSLAALYADSTKFLALGGFLSTGLLVLLITSFFARYQAVHGIILWGGLIINSGFILYDTQLICEKRRRGDTDYVKHTLELFLDFVNVFRYILILLKERSDDNRRRRRD